MEKDGFNAASMLSDTKFAATVGRNNVTQIKKSLDDPDILPVNSDRKSDMTH